MDRRVTLRRLLAAAGLLLAVAGLLTCSNPFNLKEVLETEVKIATGKFLVVNSVSPALNEDDVNPGLALTIVFDRELDESTITDGILTLEPQAGISGYSYAYTAATRTLAIHAQPYLSDETPYTATLTKSLRGADGSELQEEYIWGFATGTYPAGNVTINGGALATNDTAVTLAFAFNDVVDKYRYSMVSEADLASKSYVATAVSVDETLSGPDGVKMVWVQYRDDNEGTESLVQADEIFYDTAPPVVSSFVVNKDVVYTNSTAVTLYNNVSDLTPLQMRFQNGMTAGGSWESYTSSKTWTLAATIGTRAVTAEFMDSAGNSTTVARDYIIYGAPVVNSASLGTAAVGSVTVFFSGGSEDTGTDEFHVYRRDYPDGVRYTSLGSGTSSVSINVPAPEGSFYYFYVRIFSAAAGGYGSYSTTYALGYTADVTVIYDGNDSADTALANSLRTVLTTDWPNHPTYGGDIDGTQPAWSVILIPQSMIPATYTAANVYGGRPVFITHGNDLSANANQTRNVTAHGHGVVCMGTGGAQLLDTVANNWAAWGFSGTSPSEITYGQGAGLGSNIYLKTWTTGNSTWSSPLVSSGVPGISLPGDTTPDHDAVVQMAYGDVYRRGIYRAGPTPTPPIDGALLGKDYNYSQYFPLVRQGRFLHYGFYALPARVYTGYVNLVNLVALMDNY